MFQMIPFTLCGRFQFPWSLLTCFLDHASHQLHFKRAQEKFILSTDSMKWSWKSMSSLMNVLNLGECSNFIKAFPIILLCFRWSGPSRFSGYKLQWLTVEDMTVYVGFHSDKIQETMILKYGLDGLILRKNVYPFLVKTAAVSNDILTCICDPHDILKIYDFASL